MNPIFKVTVLCVAVFSIAACTKGKASTMTPPVDLREKALNCDQLRLEMNDANYIVKTAQKNKGLSARNILWPFGYPATYMSAEEAITNAENRMRYLESVYRIKECDKNTYEDQLEQRYNLKGK